MYAEGGGHPSIQLFSLKFIETTMPQLTNMYRISFIPVSALNMLDDENVIKKICKTEIPLMRCEGPNMF